MEGFPADATEEVVAATEAVVDGPEAAVVDPAIPVDELAEGPGVMPAPAGAADFSDTVEDAVGMVVAKAAGGLGKGAGVVAPAPDAPPPTVAGPAPVPPPLTLGPAPPPPPPVAGPAGPGAGAEGPHGQYKGLFPTGPGGPGGPTSPAAALNPGRPDKPGGPGGPGGPV